MSAVARKLNVGREISDRVIFMLKGELLESAKLAELFETPGNRPRAALSRKTSQHYKAVI